MILAFSMLTSCLSEDDYYCVSKEESEKSLASYGQRHGSNQMNIVNKTSVNLDAASFTYLGFASPSAPRWVKAVSVSEGDRLTIKTTGLMSFCGSEVKESVKVGFTRRETPIFGGRVIPKGSLILLENNLMPNAQANENGNKWITGINDPASFPPISKYCNAFGTTNSAPCWNVFAQGVQANTYRTNGSLLMQEMLNWLGSTPSVAFKTTENSKMTLGFTDAVWNSPKPVYGGFNFSVTTLGCVSSNGEPLLGDSVPKMLAVLLDPDTNPNDGNFNPLNHASSLLGANITDFTISSSRVVWLAINDDVYSDNLGSFTVDIAVVTSDVPTDGPWSNVINAVGKEIRKAVFGSPGSQKSEPGAAGKIFKNITCMGDKCRDFRNFITIFMTIYVMTFGIGYLSGTINLTGAEVMIRSTKIAFVTALISPGSWNFFFDHVLVFFIEGTDWLIAGMSNCQPSNPFCFLDNFVGYITSSVTWKKLAALLITSAIGWVFFLIVLYGMWQFACAILQAFCAYMISILIIALLVIIAPIFISFLLFKQTKYLFDNWFKYLLYYTIEPALVIFSVAFLMYIYAELLYSLLYFQVCWKCAFPLSFYGWDIICLPFFTPFGHDNFTSTPFSSAFFGLRFDPIIAVLLLIISGLTDPMIQFVRSLLIWTVNVRTSQSFLPGDSHGRRAEDSMYQGMTESARSIIGRDRESIGRRQQFGRSFISRTAEPEAPAAPIAQDGNGINFAGGRAEGNGINFAEGRQEARQEPAANAGINFANNQQNQPNPGANQPQNIPRPDHVRRPDVNRNNRNDEEQE